MPSLERDRGPSPFRRWLMPAVVIVVGGMLALWGVQRESARAAAIEQQVRKLCRNIAANVNLDGAINPYNSTVDREVADALRDVIRNADDAEIVQIKVRPGEAPGVVVNSAAQKATHTATLAMAGHELLGLRIECDDPLQPITILGYWIP